MNHIPSCSGGGCKKGREPENCDCYQSPYEGISFRAFWLAYAAFVAACLAWVGWTW
jgi:hypothetical protein